MRRSFSLLAASVVFAMAFTISCDSNFKDSRDGKTYKKVKIGKQTWMAENLDYEAEGSKCYGEDAEVVIGYDENGDPITKTLSPAEVQANCDKYSRLYDWETALKACPSGWHLPNDEEWQKLVDIAVGGEIAGTKLKATSGWKDNDGASGNGTDEYGFSALPGGIGSSDGSFNNVGYDGVWWSATENDSNYAYDWDMGFNRSNVRRGYGYKSYLFSVRCVQD